MQINIGHEGILIAVDIAHSSTAYDSDPRHRLNYDGSIEIGDGPTNMARDLALVDAESPRFRIYRWTEPWVTLGAFQNRERDILPECLVPWIIRPTAGKAVLHGHDLTIGFASPLASLGVINPRALRSIYRAMVRPILAAFDAVGIGACLGEQAQSVGPRSESSDCFAAAATNDVVERKSGKKICGCALRVFGEAVLMQCSIPKEAPGIDPASVFVAPSEPHWVAFDDLAFAEALRAEVSNAMAPAHAAGAIDHSFRA